MPVLTMNSGIIWNITDPSPDDVDIEDIAHSLSLQCRYNGHTSEFYSVAQHSVLVANMLPDEHKLAGLLHDAAEAYIGDMPSPLKGLMPIFSTIEDVVMSTVLDGLGLTHLDMKHKLVKHADLVLLSTEARDLMPGSWTAAYYSNPDVPTLPTPLLEQTIVGWEPIKARRLFLEQYLRLTGGPIE